MNSPGKSAATNVLVTGAAGYIGSICAEVLVARGYKVIGLDNLSEGHCAAVPAEAEFWECDLGDAEKLNRLFDSERIDAVMHLAADALVEKSVREPGRFYVNNVACSVHLLDAMLRHGVKDMVFSSTAAVYGEPQQVPIPEEHRKAPINPYGQSKLIFEEILDDFRTFAGLRYVTLRYFNAAGASQEHGEHHRDETHLIPRILEVAAGKRPQLEVNGNDYPTEDGTCVRDYVHVLDIAEAHLLALQHLDRVSGRAFNVGNTRGHSVREVLEVSKRVTGKPIAFTVAPRRAGDPAVLVASSEKIRRELGWTPHHSSLESIVETAWAWHRRFPQGYPPTARTQSSAKD